VSATHILKSFHGLNVVQLSLAKPLSYTRGSIIPLSLSIQCTDEQILDLLSAPDAAAVRLLCNIHYTSRKKDKQGANQPPTAVHGPADASYYAEFRIAQQAVWWVPKEQPETGVRHLRGEIHIDPGLKPGLLTPEFRLFVSVCTRLVQFSANECMCSTLSASLRRTCRRSSSPGIRHERVAAGVCLSPLGRLSL
jgi:hypothetical protein